MWPVPTPFVAMLQRLWLSISSSGTSNPVLSVPHFPNHECMHFALPWLPGPVSDALAAHCSVGRSSAYAPWSVRHDDVQCQLPAWVEPGFWILHFAAMCPARTLPCLRHTMPGLKPIPYRFVSRIMDRSSRVIFNFYL